MYEEIFQEMHLNVIELPTEIVNELPVYSGYLKELPMIAGEGTSRKAMYRQLMEKYQDYAEAHREENTEVDEGREDMTSALLSFDQLLKYYDGETFDGFSITVDEEE
jgi:hypothetical protein